MAEVELVSVPECKAQTVDKHVLWSCINFGTSNVALIDPYHPAHRGARKYINQFHSGKVPKTAAKAKEAKAEE
uniref:60S large subunit ribosomal protein Egr1 variant 1 n=1 Tax=Euglena gracilis TaxID=3039 RepID=A0A7L5NWM4_EUGGR|nr:60S large subunit ribosomal protein Egr1 variant 1 [Euglena gracilis]6ZJ3_Lo Chain Lo, Ribosomal protein eLEgr1 [Euglena gracilis]